MTVRNLIALVPDWAVCIGGYYLYEALITRNFAAPLAGIPGCITQPTLCSVMFVALDKKKLLGGTKP